MPSVSSNSHCEKCPQYCGCLSHSFRGIIFHQAHCSKLFLINNNTFWKYQKNFSFSFYLIFSDSGDFTEIKYMQKQISNTNQNQSVENKQAQNVDRPPVPKSSLYFKKLLFITSDKLFNFQTTHIMILYFILHGLKTLRDIQGTFLTQEWKQKISSYIMSLYLQQSGGFTCSSLYRSLENNIFTYSALNSLYILSQGDISKFLNQEQKKATLNSVQACKKENGSFSNFQSSSEADLRFIYAALSICNILGDFSIVNRQKTISYIRKCFNFDGGFGLRPYCQSHSGAIYCAIASLKHLKYQLTQIQKNRTLRFLVSRQTFHKQNQSLIGVQGRVGKLPDSCYSYWVGASICMLTGKNLLTEKIQIFLMTCYDEASCSFAKFPLMKGDPLHTLHSNVGLKIIKEFNKQEFRISFQQGLQM